MLRLCHGVKVNRRAGWACQNGFMSPETKWCGAVNTADIHRSHLSPQRGLKSPQLWVCIWKTMLPSYPVFYSVPCPSLVFSGRMGCRSLWPVVLPVSDWSSRRSSFVSRDPAVFRPEENPSKQSELQLQHSQCRVLYRLREAKSPPGRWSHGKAATLMFCASTLAFASNSRLMTVVLPASTAQCSAVFLWYLSPKLTDTLKVSRRRVGSTLSQTGGSSQGKAHCWSKRTFTVLIASEMNGFWPH